MGRPNELTGQVRPNTLSTPGGRRASLSPVPGAPGWTSSRPASPTTSVPTQAFPSGSASPRSGAARPARLWSVIVFGVIAFNILRAIANGVGSGGSDSPTTAPFSAGPVATPFVTVDPSVTAGAVDFGTVQDADCGVAPLATSFTAGTKVWWLAHLGTSLAGSAKVVVKLIYDGGPLDQFTGPNDTSTAPWNELCAGEPIQYYGLGTYRLDVWDSTETVLLATGSFDLTEDPAHTTGPNPDTTATITFGTGLGDSCALQGQAVQFPQGAKVWWTAPLWFPEPAPARVLFILTRDDIEVSRDTVPANRHNGAWDVACATAPFTHLGPGTYHLVLKDANSGFDIVSGQFRMAP